MNHRSIRLPVLSILAVLSALLLLAGPVQAGWRLMGSVGARTYGYEDVSQTDHLWLIQNTSLTVLQTGGPLSVHVSANYLGDSEDDFSESGRARLTKGYLKYGRIGSPVLVKAGRFFMARGVALGVFDGLDAQVKVNDMIRVSAFAGLLGPLNRQFELSAPDETMSFGGEVRITPAKCPMPYAKAGMVSLSYVRTQRAEGAQRHLAGLQTYHKFPNHITWMNVVQIEPESFNLYKYISRARMLGEKISGLAEIGIVSYDTPAFSWFSEFTPVYRTRTRFAADYYIVPRDWAIGAEAQMLMAANSGFRGGPVVTSPWGRAGYRVSSGDQGSTSGPWVSLHYRASECLVAYFHWQQVSYEWDAFDIATEELTQTMYGARFTPKFAPYLTASLQVQVYTTPQSSYDQRVLAGLNWRFDTGRTGR